jgi:hypothetical protein
MNKEQFIYWLKGFTSAIEKTPTPKQWETIVSELNKIKDCPNFGSPIGEGGWGTPNSWKDNAPNPSIHPFPMWQEPHISNPYTAGKTDTKVTYGSGTTSGSGVIVTDKTDIKIIYDNDTASDNGVIVTDGFIQNSSITRAEAPFTLTTTSTAYGHPSGSTINYTANLPEEL